MERPGMAATLLLLAVTLLASPGAYGKDLPLKTTSGAAAARSINERNVNQLDEQPLQCHRYNETSCRESGRFCNGTETCINDNGGVKPQACFVLWEKNEKGEFTVRLKGCWSHNGHSEGECPAKCVERRKEPKKNLLFCCCTGPECNSEFDHVPVEEPEDEDTRSTSNPIRVEPSNSGIRLSLIVGLPVVGLLLVVASIWFLRYRRLTDFNKLPITDSMPIGETQPPYVAFKPITLLEVKAQGRFGAVWKGRVCGAVAGAGDLVAVKIFPAQDKTSWMQEHEIYQLPQMRHENVLCFLGAERRGNSSMPYNNEYWLITEYHEHGSLCDYLKTHQVTYQQLLKIAKGIARGLNHLHEELPATRMEGLKPTVAHRDFKSKNVLLKPDLTACVADFGLALVFYPNEATSESLGQVGTRRYMAPEVLEGAISFSRDALLRIDMYACGLVLWELVSRCSDQEEAVGEYQLPFEQEIGPHPALEDIQDIVCQQKKRPVIKESWRRHSGLRVICETFEECWDQDAEARLSASCVEERINSLKGADGGNDTDGGSDDGQLFKSSSSSYLANNNVGGNNCQSDAAVAETDSDDVRNALLSPLVNETCT